MKFPVSYDDIQLDVLVTKASTCLPRIPFYFLISWQASSTAPEVNKNRLPVLDMGTGSGIVSLLLSRHFTQVHAIDVNPNAIEFLKSEVGKRGLSSKFTLVNSSLMDPFIASLPAPLYFLACFNPPYLPKENDNDDIHEIKTGKDHLKQALYSPGGGASVLMNFLSEFRNFLKPGGHVFFIYSSLSGIDNLEKLVDNLDYVLMEKTKIHRFFEDIYACHVRRNE